MKKIALMSWYNYKNYGTALQVSAIVIVLKNLGYHVDVINYTPNARLLTLKNFLSINFYIQKIIKKLYFLKNTELQNELKVFAFNLFLNDTITLTDECKTNSDLFLLNEKYDVFICGSDQIWAPSLFNEKYFLNFVQNPEKMIAFAPSIGMSNITDQYVKNRMSENISRFKHLSVREEEGAKLIKQIFNMEAKVVLDPTLLIAANEWDTFAKPFEIKSQYILCYFLGTNRKNWNHVYKLCNKKNIPLKIIAVYSADYNRGYDVIDGVGPGEFISLVKNASIVCTDSFHATIFSIIYNKPFFVYERFLIKEENNQNSRIYNILKLLKLENRLITNKNINYELAFNYDTANQLLENEKKKTCDFLKNALEKATCEKNTFEFKITNTCCGCGVCSIICPTNAIKISRDENGFLKSFINHKLCISCNKCKAVCPFNNKKSNEIDKNRHSLYMLKSLDKNTLETTTSGGAGYEIAKALSIEGYDVVGCIYDKERREAVHKVVKAGDIDSLNAFKGSKYLQSETTAAFNDVVKNSNKAVIFGTPCQITGINFLLKEKKMRNSFVLVDLICYGVPSQNLWNKYLKEISCKYGYNESPDVKFREKSKGWMKKFIQIKTNNYTYIKNENLFYRFFHLRHSNMEACYECNFRTCSSADIRIGDYWGRKYIKEKDGVSMVIAMTKNGEDLLNKLKNENKIILKKNECTEYWTVQCTQNPIKPVFYNELLKDLTNEKKSLDEIARLYCKGFEFYNKLLCIYSHFISLLNKVKE